MAYGTFPEAYTAAAVLEVDLGSSGDLSVTLTEYMFRAASILAFVRETLHPMVNSTSSATLVQQAEAALNGLTAVQNSLNHAEREMRTVVQGMDSYRLP